jgi:ABC-2 type transport system permease protein
MPEKIKNFFLILPFSCGVYVPVGYITGRIGIESLYQGFVSTTLGLIIMSVCGYLLWKSGVKKYVGTGA